MEIPISAPILGKNLARAQALRERFDASNTRVINLISSPGAGKTTLLEKTIQALQGDLPLAVIEGDIATTRDADRIKQAGAPAVQINTHGACHLDAAMIEDAVNALGGDYRLLVIENVGNLVCPAEFDLGEHSKVAILSVTEGEDKPSKYPLVFLNAQAAVISKIDLLPYLDCDLELFIAEIRAINPNIAIFPLSSKTGDGMPEWLDWVRHC